MKKVWILKPVKDKNGFTHADWEPWYDKCFGIVVTASSSSMARHVATVNSADETGEHSTEGDAWLNPKKSTCVELSSGETDGLVMRDVYYA